MADRQTSIESNDEKTARQPNQLFEQSTRPESFPHKVNERILFEHLVNLICKPFLTVGKVALDA